MKGCACANLAAPLSSVRTPTHTGGLARLSDATVHRTARWHGGTVGGPPGLGTIVTIAG